VLTTVAAFSSRYYRELSHSYATASNRTPAITS